MLAARLIAEVDNAAVLQNALLHSVIHAARNMHEWMVSETNVEEVVTAGLIAIRHLKSIEEKALDMTSTVLKAALLEELHYRREAVEKALLQRKVEFQTHLEKMPSGEKEKLKSGKAGGFSLIDWSLWPKAMKENEEENDDSQVSDAEEHSSDALGNPKKEAQNTLTEKKKRVRNPNGPHGATSNDIQGAVNSILPSDRRRTRKKASLWCATLTLILCFVLTLSIGILLECHQAEFRSTWSMRSANTTEDHAQLVREALDHLGNTLETLNSTTPTMYLDAASAVLMEMTTRKSAPQDIVFERESFITEFRGAVQDFQHQNMVTQVTTRRFLGAACMTNLTFALHPENDIFAGKDVVMNVLTPHDCINDVGDAGVFQSVIPSYLRYTNAVTTYRGTMARLTTFYEEILNISVAVTHDYLNFEDTMVPRNTRLQKSAEVLSNREEMTLRLTQWLLTLWVFMIILLVALMQYAMLSTLTHHTCIFSFLTGGLVMTELICCVLLLQYSFGIATNDHLRNENTGVVQSVGSLLLSPTLKQYNLTDTVFESLASGLLKGRLFAYNADTDEVRPAAMQGIADTIGAGTISRERRGMYEEEVAGYVVSSTFLYATEWNYIVVLSIPNVYHWSPSILVVFAAFLVCTGVTAAFLSGTPLRRLRPYAVESYFLRYCVHPSQTRLLYYALVLVLSLGGAVGLGIYEVIWYGNTIAVQAASTMRLLSAMLRAQPIQSLCTDNCGMPDFVLTLYFQKVQRAGSTYPTGEYLTDALPFPYPSAEEGRDMNTGLQLLLDGTHATLMNIPSFSTPLVNATQNITYPPHIIRNMLTTATIGDDMGFMMERFPTSFSNFSLACIVLTFAICLLLCIAVVVITISERWYISLHDRWQKKRSLRLPYAVLAGLVLLPVMGFILMAFLPSMWTRQKLIQFSHQELSLMASAIGYRMGMLMLEVSVEPNELLEFMEQVADNASDLAQVMGSTFCRVRLLEEYPERGSGMVRVLHKNNTRPVNLGSVENRYIPVCGETEGAELSFSTTKRLQYCYVEVPQHLLTTAAVQPRIFTLVTTQVESMIDAPLAKLVRMNIGMCCVMAGIVGGVLWIVLFLTMYTAHHTGYPLLSDAEVVEVTSLVGHHVRISTASFFPRRHRLCWIGTLVVLALILLYYCCAMNILFGQLESSNHLLLADRTQYEEGTSVVQTAITDAYNYIVFPFPDHTLLSLLTLRNAILDGKSDFTFISDADDAFTQALLAGYNSLAPIEGGMSASIGAASAGFSSFTSYLASSYASMFISTQTLFLTNLLSIWDVLETELPTLPNVQYASVIQFASLLTEAYDLSVKLFLLDHMAVASSVPFGYVTISFWVFGDEKVIIDHVDTAAEELLALTTSAIANLKATLKDMTSSTTTEISGVLNELADMLAVTVAVMVPSSSLWPIQVSRCDEILAAQNQTLLDIASDDETSQLGMIQDLQENLTNAMKDEIRFRRTAQLVDFINEGRALEGIQTAQAWERWLGVTDKKQRFVLAFYFVFIVFLVFTICILAQWWWMGMRTIRVHEEMERKANALEKPWRDTNDRQEGDPPLRDTAQPQNGNAEERGHGVQEEAAAQAYAGEGANGIRRPLSTGHSEKEEVAFLPFPYRPPSSTASLTSHASFLSFHMTRNVIVMGIFLLLSLVPLCCCHWVMLQAQQNCLDNLQDNSLVLALYPKVNSLLSTLQELPLELVRFYDGVVSETYLESFMDGFETSVRQLELEFVWDTEGNKVVGAEKFADLFERLFNTIQNEVDMYLDITSVLDVADYFTPQTAYARATLQNISNESVYGVLLPVSSTTTGSPLSIFMNHTIDTALTRVDSINTTAEFGQLFQSLTEVCKSVQNVASAELALWHSIVAAAMEEGASIAVRYGDFESLVGAAGISAIEGSEDSSAAAAAASIQAYFETLLTNYGTSAQQRNLFTNTESAPLDAAASVLHAYQAAGYTSSYLTATNTEGKFSNVFGYNRNLTANSVTEAGKKTLVELLDEFRSSILELYNDLTPGELSVSLASTNTYIWSTQFELTRTTTSRYQNLSALHQILWWCCITSFWILILALAVGSYFMDLF